MDQSDSSRERGVMRSVCLLCQEKLSREGSLSGESGSSLKSLFQYLKVEVSKVPLESSESEEDQLSEDCCWTEEEIVASGICGECDLLVELFGVKSKVFEAALRYMKQCIRNLAMRLKINCVPGTTPAPGDGLTKYYNLKAEILKMCELKLKSKPSDEELPGLQKQQSDNNAPEERSSSQHARNRQSDRVQDEQSNGVWTVWRRQSDDVEVEGDHLNDSQEEDQSEGALDSNSKLDDNFQNPSSGKKPTNNGNQMKSRSVTQRAGATGKSHDLIEADLVSINSLEGGPPPGGWGLPLAQMAQSDDELQEEPLDLIKYSEPFPSTSSSSGRQLQDKRVVSPPSPPPEVMAVPTYNTEKMMRQRLDAESYFLKTRSYYKRNPIKPPFTAAFMIKEAMWESQNKGLKHSEICEWFQSNFSYFTKSAKIAASLRKTISVRLSEDKCFMRVKVDDRDLVWRVNDRKFYKPGRKWLLTQSKFGKPKTPNRNIVETEVLEQSVSNSNVEPSSSPSVLFPQAQSNQGNIQKERGGGNRNNRVGSAITTSQTRDCLYCGMSLRGSSRNLDRHMMCMHTIEHFPELAQLGTSQTAVNIVIFDISKQSIQPCPGKPRAYQCTLCGQDRAGDSKHHLLKAHMPNVLTRLRQAADRAPAPASDFDESMASMASSDLQNHNIQERTETEPPYENNLVQADNSGVKNQKPS